MFNSEQEKEVQKDINSVTAGKLIDWNKLLGSSPVEKSELSQLLFDVTQLCDGYRQDDTWSEWDESVRSRVFELYKKLNS